MSRVQIKFGTQRERESEVPRFRGVGPRQERCTGQVSPSFERRWIGFAIFEGDY